MRAYFELNDKGTCKRFTRIRGVQKDHIFINEGKGASKLRFEGTEAQFEYVMRDIYGVHPSLRTTPIFVYVELPNLTEIQEHITVLTNKNKALKEYSDHLEKQIEEIQASRPVDHPFPLGTPKADAPRAPRADVGLPVGPEPAGTAPKGKAEPGPAPTKLTRAEWLKLSPQAKRDLASLPKPVEAPKKMVKKGGESRLTATGKRK